MGRSIIRWIIARKARNFIVLSRSGRQSKVADEFFQEMIGSDVRVEAPACDITDAVKLQKTLAGLAGEMPPVRGCIQASMVPRVS